MAERKPVQQGVDTTQNPTPKEEEAMQGRSPAAAEARKEFEEERAQAQAEAAANSPQVKDAP